MPPPLPTNLFVDGSHRQAYQRALALEAAHINATSRTSTSALVCARILGRLMLEAYTPEGRQNVANEINGCQNELKLIEFGNLWKALFIRCLRANKGRKPEPSDHPSRPSWDNQCDTITRMLEKGSLDHRDAKDSALIRDNHRCVITRCVDLRSSSTGATYCHSHEVSRHTQLVHILDFSTTDSSGELEGSNKELYAGGMAAVLMRFGNVSYWEELNGNDVHKLENVMTMTSDYHLMFDSLDIWLEETEQVNVYTLRATDQGHIGDIDNHIVHLTSADDRFALPDPRYIKLHAACARVAHLSGAGRYMDRVLSDAKRVSVLSEDGSSYQILADALLQAIVA